MTDLLTIDQVNAILSQMDQFQPCAWYSAEADQLNFLVANKQYGTRRVDGLITKFVELDTGDLVGFKIKGFRDLYTKVTGAHRVEADDQGFIDLLEFVDYLFWHVASTPKDDYKDLRVMAKGYKAPPPDLKAA